jgi:hypothetical protein
LRYPFNLVESFDSIKSILIEAFDSLADARHAPGAFVVFTTPTPADLFPL